MSFNKTKTAGFTIVELLIVIVVIGILAAITIVAYNGIQNRARATNALNAAVNILKKAEIYNTDDTAPTVGYPVLPSQLSGATSDKSYAITNAATFSVGTGGVSPNFTTAPTTAPASPTVLNFYSCGATGGTRVDYWDYAATTPAWKAMYAGGGTAGTCATFKSAGATT